jgi:hypothetical protein
MKCAEPLTGWANGLLKGDLKIAHDSLKVMQGFHVEIWQPECEPAAVWRHRSLGHVTQFANHRKCGQIFWLPHFPLYLPFRQPHLVTHRHSDESNMMIRRMGDMMKP